VQRRSAQRGAEGAEVSAAGIARALNGRREGRRWRCQCPACGRGNLMISEMPGGKHLVKCWNGCDYKEVFVALFAQGLLQGDDDDGRDHRRFSDNELEERNQREEIEKLARRIEQARDLYYCRAVRAAGTIVETYWRNRGLAVPLPPVLRFLRHCPHRLDPRYDRDYYPAMLARVVDIDGHQIGIHKTFLKPDGSGKWPFSDKRLQRETCGRIGGGAVRLAPYDPRRALAVGEGIENAASAMHLLDLPGWAALSAPGIKSLELPECVRNVVIAVDNDENGTGQEAALFAYEKWTGEGRSVRLMVPPNVGEDFNDLLPGKQYV
jgi:putative DNA primase/helicase